MSAPSQIATSQDFNITVDAIWAVRRAAAYEAAAYEQTATMNMPKDAVHAHEMATLILKTVATGQERAAAQLVQTQVSAEMLNSWFEADGAEQDVNLDTIREWLLDGVADEQSKPVDPARFEAARQDLHDGRLALMASAWLTYNTTVYKTFPPSRRRITEQQHTRIAEFLQLWNFSTAYTNVKDWSLDLATRDLGVNTLLTNHMYFNAKGL